MGFWKKLATPPEPSWLKGVKKNEDKSKCKNCKSPLKEGINFCPNCGIPVNAKPVYPGQLPGGMGYPIIITSPFKRRNGNGKKSTELKTKTKTWEAGAIFIVIILFGLICYNRSRQDVTVENPPPIVKPIESQSQVPQIGNNFNNQEADTGNYYFGNDGTIYKYKEVQIGGYREGQ